MEHHFHNPMLEINNFKLMNFYVYNYKIKDTNKYLNILIPHWMHERQNILEHLFLKEYMQANGNSISERSVRTWGELLGVSFLTLVRL